MLIRHCLSIVVVTCLTAWSGLPAADLLFSEYVEGSSNNKALEIFNSGEETVDLSTVAVAIAFNGNDTPSSTIQLAGSLAPAEVFVLAYSSAALPEGIADLKTGSLSMNGNDAILLLIDDQVVDSIGQQGVDPGSAWTSNGVSTLNMTLRRRQPLTPDADPSDSFDPSVQWEAAAQDDFTHLGLPPQVAVSAQAVAHDRIALEWEAVPGATGYRVFRRLASGGDYTIQTETAAAVTAWLDDSCEPATAYEYRVWALTE